MPANEIDKIVTFISEQHKRSRHQKHFRRRISFFGFSIEDTDDGPMIATLPRRHPVCPAPAKVLA